MRLWHYEIVPYLDRNRLLGQNRECCALRGKAWGKKHSTVNYVFHHSYRTLFMYHFLVISVMISSNYNVDYKWFYPHYRGKILGFVDPEKLPNVDIKTNFYINPTYPEHNRKYYNECKKLLLEKDYEYYSKIFK